MPPTSAKRKAQNRDAQRKHRQMIKARKEHQQPTLLPPQSISVVIPPREPAPDPPSQPPYDPPMFAAVDPPCSGVAPAIGNTPPTPWQPNLGSMDLTFPNTTFPNTTFPNTTFPNTTFPNTTFPNSTFPDTAYPTQLPTCTSEFSQMMLRMLDSQRSVRKRRADAELSRIQSAHVIRRNRLEASKLRTTLLEISHERERFRQP